MNAETKICQNCKNSFVIEPEDFDFYAKIKVPPPTFCPDCRLQRRMAFRNERSLYKHKCGLCTTDIIAMFSPDSPFTVYCPFCFFSDKWDPLDYGREYDPMKSFFTQWKELSIRVPHLALLQKNTVNSPWINYETDDKNCYLNFGGHLNEDSAYNQYLLKSRDSFDNFWLMGSEHCYQSILSESCYKTFFSKLCTDCRDTYFSFDCRNCSNIFGCSSLRHKQYCIFNKRVTKEEYEKFMAENNVGSFSTLQSLKNRAEEFFRTTPQRAVFIDKSVHSTGNLIKESKNCRFCWNAEKAEDTKYGLYVLELKDSMDATSIWKSELCYDAMGGITSSNIKLSVGFLDQCRNLEYCYLTFNCHDCFGSINLRTKNYCILNRQYEKDEFEKLRARIIEDMNAKPYLEKGGRTYRYGEYLPYELSPFAYRESVANEYFPLIAEQVKEKGFNEGEYTTAGGYEFSDYIIPDDIKEVRDDVLDKVLKCEVSGKPYRIIKMELEFYRKHNLPIPRISPFARHRERLSFVADHCKIYVRMCNNCGKETESVYTEQEFPIVYCTECYLQTII